MSDSDDGNIPDVGTCQELVRQFAEITSTDEACAQFYLQDREWDLERSVNAFFESSSSGGIHILEDGDEPEVVINVNKDVVNALNSSLPTVEPPKNFSFLSWNLDGLNDHNLKRRTKAVCKIVRDEKYDIVFLQEVVPHTCSYIEAQLPEYMSIPGNVEGYFTLTLLRRFTVYFDGHEIIPFKNSVMMRNLLKVEAHIGPVKLVLLNAHLESTKDHSAERINQLKRAFLCMQAAPETHTVIFGGDLNLRDKELQASGGNPPGIQDLWQVCGSPKQCQYTWDAQRNSNIDFPGNFRPRLRFDRIYVRHSQPRSIVPEYFGLVGMQKVSETQSFPSDHWGIRIHFDVEKTEKEEKE